MNNKALSLEVVESHVQVPGVVDRVFKWAGIGSMLELENNEGRRNMPSYSLTRQDGKRYFAGINYYPPEVVRFVSDSSPEEALDWAGYGCESTNRPMFVDTYKLPKVIKDVNYHLYGEWPIRSGRMAFESLRTFAAAKTVIEAGEGVAIETRAGTFRNLGAISLEDVGTLPIYPYKSGTHHYVEQL